jgi:hypothetical protein
VRQDQSRCDYKRGPRRCHHHQPADLGSIGQALQLAHDGLKVALYRSESRRFSRAWSASRRGAHARDRLRPKVRRDALNIGNPSPSPMVEGGRATRGADSTIPRRSHRKHLRRARNHPSANSPIGHASGADASRVHSRHAPAQRTARRQARSRWVWAEAEPPVPTRTPVLPCLLMQELLRAHETLAVFGNGGLNCGGDF